VLVIMMERILVVLGLLVGYAMFVALMPKMDCTKCRGWGNRKKRMRRVRSACGKCGATGRQFRPGARLVHHGICLAVEAIRELVEQRRRAE
jgi:hypothetical protein